MESLRDMGGVVTLRPGDFLVDDLLGIVGEKVSALAT